MRSTYAQHLLGSVDKLLKGSILYNTTDSGVYIECFRRRHVSPPKNYVEIKPNIGSGDTMTFYKVQVTPEFTFKLGSDAQKYLVLKPGVEPQITERIHWPNHCPCCGGENNTYIKTKFSQRRPHWSGGIEETFYEISIPYCQTCVNHINSAVRGIWVGGTAGLLIFIILGAIAIQTALSGLNWLMIIPFLLGAVGGYFGGVLAYRLYNSKIVTPMLQENCCSPFAAVNPGGYEGGALVFFFRRNEYASEFANLNGVKDIKEVKSISIGFS